MGVMLGVSLHCLVPPIKGSWRIHRLPSFLQAAELSHSDTETERLTEKNNIVFPVKDRMALIYFPCPWVGDVSSLSRNPPLFGMQFLLPHSQNRMRRLYFVPAARLYNPHLLMLF
jgi:hypothetical protein